MITAVSAVSNRYVSRAASHLRRAASTPSGQNTSPMSPMFTRVRYCDTTCHDEDDGILSRSVIPLHRAAIDGAGPEQ